MRNKSGRPEGFVVYGKTLQSVCLLPEESAGRVLKAAARLFLTGETPEDLTLSEQIVFALFQADIDGALARHAEICARNQRIAANRRPPNVTSGDESLPLVPNRTKQNRDETKRKETETKSTADKPPRARFVPPSLEEVRTYCGERGNAVDPQRFLDYYTANGWVQGKGKPIRDWKACVRTWERSEQAKAAAPDMSWRTERPRWEADAHE